MSTEQHIIKNTSGRDLPDRFVHREVEADVKERLPAAYADDPEHGDALWECLWPRAGFR